MEAALFTIAVESPELLIEGIISGVYVPTSVLSLLPKNENAKFFPMSIFKSLIF